MQHHVLLVEDEAIFAKAVKKRLERNGFIVNIASDIASAREDYAAQAPDLLLLDMRLPDGSGLDFLTELKQERRSPVPVLVMSAYGELEDAVSAMRKGAADYLKKPIDLEELLINAERLIRGVQINRRLEYSAARERHATEQVEFLGQCPALQAVRAQVGKIADVIQGAQVAPPTVLVLGETGTGKDVLARLLHASSIRRTRPFVHVDCAALPKDLIEAELFGHEKGAFTDAHSGRVGLIEAAEDGVLFLDEIGELPLGLQGKFLAVLERRTLRRIGTARERPVAAWIMAATNRDVAGLVDSGGFRADLYYRLNVLSVHLPPLRERGEDILLLAEHFAAVTGRRYGLTEVRFTEQAKQHMLRNLWQGNVRELQHLIERAVLLNAGGSIDVAELGLSGAAMPAPAVPPSPVASTAEASAPVGGASAPLVAARGDGVSLYEAECNMIRAALQRTQGNLSKAARELGITRMAVRYRAKKHNINISDYKGGKL